MMNQELIKCRDYLKGSHEVVVVPMQRAGLDGEFLYRYMTEMASVPGCGYDKDLIDNQRRVMLNEWGNLGPGSCVQYQCNFAIIFDRQWRFMTALIAYIDKNYGDDVRKAVQAQIVFMKIALHTQRIFLDTVLYWTPYRYLDATDGGKEYTAALSRHDEMLKKVDALATKFQL